MMRCGFILTRARILQSGARAAIAASIMGIIATPTFADVIEVGTDGNLTVYNAPSVFRSEGVQRIEPIRIARRPGVESASAAAAIGGMISSAAERYAIDAKLLRLLAWQESRFHHDAVSRKGAVGVMQLMPGTARDLGVDRYDLSQNILGGAAYLRQMLDRYGGDQSLALAAYNAGPGAVDRYRGIPPFLETKTYVAAVGGLWPAKQSIFPSVILFDR
jgi:soluble lytic murein transglycosylase-like protein